jgi:heterodisulfide reductase subunit C
MHATATHHELMHNSIDDTLHNAGVTHDHAHCSGCSLCVLVCPVWRATRDLRLSPEGRCKALQHGADIDAIAPALEACTLCSACEAVCPENIDLIDSVLVLRQILPAKSRNANARAAAQEHIARQVQERTSGIPAVPLSAPHRLLAGGRSMPEERLLAGISKALACEFNVADAGDDIVAALEAGVPVPPERRARLLGSLAGARLVTVADGLLARQLRRWAPTLKVASLGEALSGVSAVRRALQPSDLYVIEPRAFHADYERLVTHYDALRQERGCVMNLDLQRIAVPASMLGIDGQLGLKDPHASSAQSAQIDWILHGRAVKRIVVEDWADVAHFKAHTTLPVLHSAELLDAA